MATHALQKLLAGIASAFRPLGEAAANPNLLREFLEEIGWNTRTLPRFPTEEITGALSNCTDSIQALEAATEEPPTSFEEFIGLVVLAANLFADIRELRGAMVSAGLASEQASELLGDLTQSLLARHIQVNRPETYRIAELLGLISTAAVSEPSLPHRGSGQVTKLHPERLAELISNPPAFLKARYSDALAAPNAHFALERQVFPLLEAWLRSVGVPASYGLDPGQDLSLDSAAQAIGPHLLLLYLPIEDGRAGVGLSLSAIEGNLALVMVPFGGLTHIIEGSRWTVSLDATVTVPGLSVSRLGVQLPTGTDGAITAKAGVVPAILDREPTVLFGVANSIRLESLFARASVSAALARDKFDFGVELEWQSIRLALSGGDGDGFLSKALPAEGIEADFPLSLGWSLLKGFHFGVSASFELSLPLHASVGPIALDTVDLTISLDGGQIGATVTGNPAIAIGPIVATVEHIGLRANARLAGNGTDGNVGPLDVDLGIRWPDGAGLAVNAGAVTGGGFLSRDDALGRYAGILDLKFGEIGLVAVALITSKLPGGKKGYALFINIGVTFSPPITLPYNFTLQGCGGLLALNRTMDVEALRTGLKNKTLDSILFPEDPILNASKIINDSETVFPIEEGRFVVGPMAKLGWGTNGLLVADIAIVIELPAPIIIAVLGQIKIRLPKGDEAKIKLNVDVLGVLDVAKKSLAIDATLYDSKLVKYDLSGDAALRLNWGQNPVFAMSLGGFHPKFDPPPKFPKLRRLTLQLSSSNSLEMSCTVYQALTSNTLQMGAGLRIHAEACGAEVDGKLSFDTLIIFSPFEFEVDLAGSVSASYRGRDIASVHLNVDLSGPNPWHAKGKAKISVACFDCTARFNKTWGNDEKARLSKIDPRVPFLAELDLPANWGSAVLPRRSMVESLKDLEPTTGGPQPFFLAHPAGALEVRQRLLPLDLTLEKFGNAGVKDHFKFDITLDLGPAEVPAGWADLAVENVRIEEKFAKGQYRDISKSDRLSRPSYEPFKAGARVAPTKARIDGTPIECDLEFESILIQKDGASAPPVNVPPAWLSLRRTLGLGALRFGGIRRQGIGKFKIGGPPRIAVRDEAYSVVSSTTLTRASGFQPASGRTLTYTEAEDLAAAAGSTAVMVLPDYEEEAE